MKEVCCKCAKASHNARSNEPETEHILSSNRDEMRDPAGVVYKGVYTMGGYRG
jgi:hypothetical protein